MKYDKVAHFKNRYSQCFTESEFYQHVAKQGYPVVRYANCSHFAKKHTAVLLRGHIFYANYTPSSSFAIRGIPYDIDVRRTFPSFEARVLKPMQSSARRVDLFYAGPEPARKNGIETNTAVKAWVTERVRPLHLWLYQSKRQFDYLCSAIASLQAFYVASREHPDQASLSRSLSAVPFLLSQAPSSHDFALLLSSLQVLIVRSDISFLPSAWQILDCNTRPGRVNHPFYDFQMKPMDALYVMSWNLLPQFHSTICKATSSEGRNSPQSRRLLQIQRTSKSVFVKQACELPTHGHQSCFSCRYSTSQAS